ncbi:dynamin family protein [Planctomicrobium sp. SH664]|uniref:dynamin family protein n=1 Tax=Planctomicrobium sp. SH664 TaxID=3448125 RepID=UPI003F5C1EC1
MLSSEVRQLELLAAIDDLRRRVENWTLLPTEWEPIPRCQLLLKRVLERVDTLRIRMETPLVVATFGGTGTGKSSLVNALVGEEVTRSGRQRPTTQRPVLIAHLNTDLTQLGLPLDEVDIVQRDAELLRDVMILDCPDPDTSEGDSPGSNLDRLRTLLPYCDVLLYASTQQKYRSARVADELATAAAGCRMIFVQTHADLDEDIRSDWQKLLSHEFEVPEIYFVDSRRGLQEQQAGQRPSGDLGRLIGVLLNKLGASERIRIRRANVLDLLHSALLRCQEVLAEKQPALDQLELALVAQNQELSRRMAAQLQSELLTSRRLWERRLLTSVTDQWGLSPFSALLRMYNSLGGIITSTVLFRAHSTAQVALLGTVQSMRWLESKRKEQAAESTLRRMTHFALEDSVLREAEIVIEGHVNTAGLNPALLKQRSLDDLRRNAVAVEDRFVGDASRRIDDIIEDLSRRNSRWWVRLTYEVFLSVYLLFVLYRVGKNFFYDSFLQGAPLLTTDFYLAATLFLLLWCAILIFRFTSRLQHGLKQRIANLATQMVEQQFTGGLFPHLEQAVRQAEQNRDEILQLLTQTTQLRHDVAGIDHLGTRQSLDTKAAAVIEQPV